MSAKIEKRFSIKKPSLFYMQTTNPLLNHAMNKDEKLIHPLFIPLFPNSSNIYL